MRVMEGASVPGSQAEDRADAGAENRAADRVVPEGLRDWRIVVAVRDYPHDAATIEWALAHTVRGVDTVHLVHAYSPLRLDGCHWQPVARARGARAMAGRRVVAIALQRIAAAYPALGQDGSAVAGTPEDVLEQMSEVADLVVVGDDSLEPATPRPITWRVQDAASCPVVCVPAGYRTEAGSPVTVVVDEQGWDPVLEFGVQVAMRSGAGLQVSRSWSALHEMLPETDEWLADQQRAFDTQLTEWQDRYPAVPISARIELDDAWPGRLRRSSSLLVATSYAAARVRSLPSDPVQQACPIAIVPDGG